MEKNIKRTVCEETHSPKSYRYHPGLWLGKKWSCCKAINRTAFGCQAATHWTETNNNPTPSKLSSKTNCNFFYTFFFLCWPPLFDSITFLVDIFGKSNCFCFKFSKSEIAYFVVAENIVKPKSGYTMHRNRIHSSRLETFSQLKTKAKNNTFSGSIC